MVENKLLTTKDLAEYLRLNERTVLNLVQNKEIPGVKIGGQWRFLPEVIDRYLQSGMEQKFPENPLELVMRDSYDIIPLSRLTSRSLIELDIDAEDCGEVLRALANIAFNAGILSDREKLVDCLNEREELLSTAIGNRIAIPHPRNPVPGLFSKPGVVIGRSKKGIEYYSPDGEKVNLFFMTCAPSVDVHLRLLAKIASMLRKEEIVDKLMKAGGSEGILRAILEFERDNTFVHAV